MTTLLKTELTGLPPTVNHLYHNGRHGLRYRTAMCRLYQDYVSLKMRTIWQDKPPYTGPVEVRITFMTVNRRRWDIDNRVKALQDCLMLSGVIEDDSQVQILHVERKQEDRKRGAKSQTQIEILSLEP